MSDIHRAQAPADSTPNAHAATERHHRYLRWGVGIVAFGFLVLVGYVFYPSALNFGRDAWTTAQQHREQAIEAGKRSAAAVTPKSASVTTTDMANDGGRASITKVTVQKLDVLDEIEKAQQAAADAKKVSADEVAAMRAELAAAKAELVAKVTQITITAPALEQSAPAPRTFAPQSSAAPVQPQRQSAQVEPNGQSRVRLDARNLPKGWSITSVEEPTTDDCIIANGKKLVTSANWVWKNGKHFFPNTCVPLSDSRPAAR